MAKIRDGSVWRKKIWFEPQLFDKPRDLSFYRLTASSQSIDLSSMPNGVYVIRLESGEVLKVVKQ